MSKRSHFPAAAAAVAATIFFGGAAHAAECLAKPNQAPAEGERWFYRTDRDTNQKCWYLRREVETTGATTVPQSAPADAEATAKSKAQPLTMSQQDELFREFLQWRVRKGR